MSASSTLVMKFGGASVANPKDFARVADIIIARSRHFDRTAIVVSAMAKMTDELIALAGQVHPQAPRREYDMLISVGERISIALLSMALAAKGVEAQSFTGSQSGIMTTDHHSEAHIIEVRPHRLLKAFDQGKLVIVAGFQGCSLAGEITTLGRGGSDTTAVALAVALGASKVEFYKDVEGVYNQDPKTHTDAHLEEKLSYQEALAIGGKVLHARCIRLAEANQVALHVRSFENFIDSDANIGTLITGKNCSTPSS